MAIQILLILLGFCSLAQSFQVPDLVEIKSCKASQEQGKCGKTTDKKADDPENGWKFEGETFEEHWIEYELKHESLVRSVDSVGCSYPFIASLPISL